MISWLLPNQLITGALEAIINQAIAHNINPELSHELSSEKIQSKQLTLHIAELGKPITLGFSGESAYLLTDTNQSDCTITTSIQTLIELKQSQQLTELIKQEKLDIQGDLKTAQQFAKVFEQLKIDWQSELAKHIGDLTTYRLSRLGHFLQNKAIFAKQQISEDFSQWLVFEKKLAVSGYEINLFHQDVSQVNSQTQQLAQRIAKLQQQLNLPKVN